MEPIPHQYHTENLGLRLVNRDIVKRGWSVQSESPTSFIIFMLNAKTVGVSASKGPDKPLHHVTPWFSLKIFIYVTGDWLNSAKRIDCIAYSWYSKSQTVDVCPLVNYLLIMTTPIL